MSEAPLMNDEAARSPTGEILDQQMSYPDSTQTTNPDGTPKTETTTAPKLATDGAAPDAKLETNPKTDASTKDESKGAPEKYADFKAPDGYTLDPKAIEAASPIFKELGLTQDQAQKLVEFDAKRQVDAAKAPAEAYEALRTKWRADVAADPDMKAATSNGKTGLDAVKLDIGRALDAIGDPELVTNLRNEMNTTGVGDNPAFVKALWKLSQFVTEGKHVAGRGPSAEGQRAPGSSAKPSPAQALYPNLPG